MTTHLGASPAANDATRVPTETAASVRPPGDRIEGYDLARALAILGMVIVHFVLVMASERADEHGPMSWLVKFLDGRAAATFVVLAGVGITLRTRRAAATADGAGAELARARGPLLNRGMFLLAVGFLNLFIWPGDILRVYGVSLLLAAWFVTAPAWRLWAASAAFVAGFVVLVATVDYSRNWDWETMEYHRLWTPGGAVRNLFYDGFRSVFPWTGLVFFGMWLGRKDMRQPAVRRRYLAWALVLVVMAELVSWRLVSMVVALPDKGLEQEEVVAVFGTESMPPMPLFLLSAAGTAVFVIGASVWAAERFEQWTVVRSMVAAGQMAFTWYVGHIVLGLGGVILFGLYDRQTVGAGAAAGLTFFAIACVVSFYWRRRFRHGPLEWLMRRVAG